MILDSERRGLLPRIIGRTDAHPTAIFLLLITALWLATRPYYGIVYDGRYYVLQAFRHLHPGAFADDLLFRFGTLERFTIVPGLVAYIIGGFGLAAGAMLVTIAGQLLWLSGLIYCAFGFIRDRRLALLSVVAVVALPAGYFRYGYGEPILTSRLFAEAVTLAALGCLARRRIAVSLGLLVVSATIHPVMTVAGIGVALIYLALLRPVWWWVIAAGGAVTIGLAFAGVDPFANLLKRFDPDWFALASARNSDAVITQWSIEEYSWIAPTVALAFMARAIGDTGQRRLFAAALMVGLGALICSFLGSKLADIFIVQMMPARSLWLLAVLAHLYVVPIVFWLHAQDGIDDLSKTAVASSLCCLLASRLIPPLILVAAPTTVVAVVMVMWQHQAARPLSALARAGCLLATVAAGAATVLFACEFVIALLPMPDELGQRLWSFAVLLAAVALAATQGPSARQRHGTTQRRVLFASAALIPIALLHYDVRTPWTRMVEAQEPALAELLPEHGSVYWEGGADLLWFGMLRSSYFSCAQGGGAVFIRDEAFEFRRRAKSFSQLHTLDFDEPDCVSFADKRPSGRTREALQAVCRQEPDLDFLVLAKEVAGIEAKVLRLPAPLRWVSGEGTPVVQETDRFYLYSCADMR